ncbi:hypothetical protein [Thalassotalea sp. ND16A]|uniref:hypothetical protein n=1 Tax=Thalassotalea sp. ND16A TaxID=1535422 RepID=UPI00051A03E6|nr:hypothetical protein [Thalassotalea sp. ND16A]KGJ96678.1 hypothetical protein ND16A_1031 [Thalassotalea sp. ND16A]
MKLLITIIILIYIPLLESLYSSTLWGLNWYSPLVMDKVGNYLLFIKIASIGLGLYLLSINTLQLRNLFSSNLLFSFQKVINFIVGCFQVALLSLGLLFIGIEGDLNKKHREEKFDGFSIYALTSDPGAMGKAYHYFYIKCPKPMGRYGLTLIKKFDWLGKFEFDVSQNILSIKTSDGNVEELDISTLKNCSNN